MEDELITSESEKEVMHKVKLLSEFIIEELQKITNTENVTFTVEIETTKNEGEKVSIKRLKKIIHY